MRAIVSLAPPGGFGTRSRMGRAGYCPQAAPDSSAAMKKPAMRGILTPGFYRVERGCDTISALTRRRGAHGRARDGASSYARLKPTDRQVRDPARARQRRDGHGVP